MGGDYAAALTLLQECLTIRHALRNWPDLVNALDLIGVTRHHLGDSLTAARLMGAGDKLRTKLGLAVAPANQAEREAALTAVRAYLGESAFAQAWAEGRALEPDAAVALALGKA